MQTINQYLLEVSKHHAAHPDLRYGQCLYIVLFENRPELAVKIKGISSIDPFYSQPNEMSGFWEFLYKEWTST